MKYKVLMTDSPISKEQLDVLVLEGWQLVAAVQWKRKYYFYFISFV
jgi:hypothetical protein